MKTVIKILILLMTISAVAQEEEEARIDFYLGFDIPNAIVGGKVLSTGERRNNNALDIKGGWTLSDGKFSFGTYLEYFEAIDYFAMGMKLGSPFRVNDVFGGETDLVITPSVLTEWVWRDGLPEESIPQNVVVNESLNWGLTLDIQLDQIFGDSPFYVEAGLGLKFRHDKYNIWGRDVDPSGTFPALWENRELYFSIGYEVFSRKR